MYTNFILLSLFQHYPYDRKFNVMSLNDDMFDSKDIADFMRANQHQVSKTILYDVYAYANAAICNDL
jgi:hypothetical protein